MQAKPSALFPGAEIIWKYLLLFCQSMTGEHGMDTDGSMTAKLCLFARAAHSSEKDPLFNDNIASKFISKKDFNRLARFISTGYRKSTLSAGAQAGPVPEKQLSAQQICGQVDCYFSPILMPRLAFTEQKLSEFAAVHKKVQYVILGAGMETFAFRNQNPDIAILELDHPYTQNFKKKRIRELGWKVPDNVHYAPIDFSKDSLKEVLKKAGFQKDVPAFFSILGVTYYLRLSVFRSTLQQVEQESQKGDQIAFDYPDETTFTSAGFSRAKRLSEIAAALGETMIQGFSYDEMKQTLEEEGLHVAEHLAPAQIEERWFAGRDNITAFPNIHLLLAEK